jgi:hypothetical protein
MSPAHDLPQTEDWSLSVEIFTKCARVTMQADAGEIDNRHHDIPIHALTGSTASDIGVSSWFCGARMHRS